MARLKIANFTPKKHQDLSIVCLLSPTYPRLYTTMPSLPLLLLLSLVLSGAVGCRNLQLPTPENTSSLRGVYDEKYLLRLSKKPGTSGLYYFEACLVKSSGHEALPDSCVGALKDAGLEDITFSLKALNTMSLSDDEKQQLNALHVRWKVYQKTLNRAASDQKSLEQLNKAGGVIIGGGAMVASVANSNLARDFVKKNSEYKTRKTHLTEIYKSRSGIDLDLLNLLEQPGEISPLDLQKRIQSLQQKLSSRGYSITEPPPSLLSEAQSSMLSSRKHLVSEKFYAFLQNHLGNHQNTLETLHRPVFLRKQTGDQRTWQGLVASFIEKGGTAEEIIHPEFRQVFTQYMATESSFWPDGGGRAYPKNMDDIVRTLQDQKFSMRLFDHMATFVSHGGTPSRASFYFNQLALTEALLGLLNSEHAHLVTTAKKQLSKAAAKIAQSRSSAAQSLHQLIKQINSLSKKLTVIALTGTAAIAALFYFQRAEVSVAQTGIERITQEHDHLQVMLDPNSALMDLSGTSHQGVVSVQQILENFILWQQNFWIDTEDVGLHIHYYALPQKSLKKGEAATPWYYPAPTKKTDPNTSEES